MSSEEALDLQRPECSDTLRGHGAEVFGFPIVHLVIFQEKQGLGLLTVWVQVTQSWLHWPVTSTVQRTPHSNLWLWNLDPRSRVAWPKENEIWQR